MNDKLYLKESNDVSHSKSVNEGNRQLWDHNSCGDLQNESNTSDRNTFSNRQSEKSKQLLADITRVARRPYNVLITGETGTGKTFAARQIHQNSIRAKGPFMELNCANLSESLVEAELFGFRRGAFTGADRDHKGLFEEADGGILFLDEIGDVAPSVQNKLLKAIDEKKIKRLGTNHYTQCDVQIISATSRNLTEMTRLGEFRIDLYCRLAVLTIEVPPLRERREDIPTMIDYYLREAAQTIIGTNGSHSSSSVSSAAFKIEQEAFELIYGYDYPGNIRTLKNLIYELTSFVHLNEIITLELAQAALAKLQFSSCSRESFNTGITNDIQTQMGHSFLGQSICEVNSDEVSTNAHGISPTHISKRESSPVLQSIAANDGDIILPAEVCVIRKGETFKEWTARAKHASIEAARAATGTMKSAAERLGVTPNSLKGHLHRAKTFQHESNLCDENA